MDDVLRLVGKINRAIHEQNETGMFLNDPVTEEDSEFEFEEESQPSESDSDERDDNEAEEEDDDEEELEYISIEPVKAIVSQYLSQWAATFPAPQVSS